MIDTNLFQYKYRKKPLFDKPKHAQNSKLLHHKELFFAKAQKNSAQPESRWLCAAAPVKAHLSVRGDPKEALIKEPPENAQLFRLARRDFF